MTAISKIITIALFVLPFSIFSDLEKGKGSTLAEKDLQILNVLESTIIAEKGKYLQHFDDVNYVLDAESTPYSQRFNVVSTLGNLKTPISTYAYLVVDNAIGQTSQVFLHYDECRNDIAILQWKDGTIDKISYDRKSYKVEYNEAGLVHKLTETSYYKFGKSLNKNCYRLKYNDEGVITTLEKYTIVGKGKKAYRAQYDWEYLSSEIIYTYKENKIDVEHRSFDKSSNRKDIARLESSQKSTLIFDEDGYTKVIYSNNNESQISKVYEKIINDNGQIVRSIESSPTFNQKIIRSSEYNDKGQVIKEVIKSALEESFDGHFESYYTYELKKGKSPMSNCSYTQIVSNSVFSSEGDKIKETRTDGLQRVKGENGNWSEWKSGQFVFGID